MSSPASPGLNALALASRAAYENDKTQTQIGEFRREQVWERGTVSSTMVTEEYFMFRNARAALICSLRKYNTPSPRFHTIMDHKTQAWVTLGVGSTPHKAMVALYSGESDHASVDLVRQFASSCRDGSLVHAWDTQVKEWELEGWGFFVDGMTARYEALFKDTDFDITEFEDGRRWLRTLDLMETIDGD